MIPRRAHLTAVRQYTQPFLRHKVDSNDGLPPPPPSWSSDRLFAILPNRINITNMSKIKIGWGDQQKRSEDEVDSSAKLLSSSPFSLASSSDSPTTPAKLSSPPYLCGLCPFQVHILMMLATRTQEVAHCGMCTELLSPVEIIFKNRDIILGPDELCEIMRHEEKKITHVSCERIRKSSMAMPAVLRPLSRPPPPKALYRSEEEGRWTRMSNSKTWRRSIDDAIGELNDRRRRRRRLRVEIRPGDGHWK